MAVGSDAAAAPPPLSHPNVAPAPATPRWAARWGAVLRGRCPCQAPRLGIVNPGSLPARKPYQDAAPALGPRAASNSRLRLKARKLGVGAPEFLRFANL